MSVQKLPAWATEPAKLVGWIVAAALTIAAGVTELVAQFSDLIPAKYQATVKVVVGAAAVVTVIATRIQALLTRNGLGPAGNGKDGVVSPATHAAELESTAIAVAAAKNVDPATHAQ